MIVLAKQVPDTKSISGEAMNPDGTVNRSALSAIFNPDDLYALELALSLKDRREGSTVTVLTMGPPMASELLREALYRGADRVILLSDRKFAASDTLATSYALSRAITTRLSPFDLVICGRQAIDGDTAQVGPQVAEKLGIPQITYTEGIRSIEGDTFTIQRNLGRSQETVRAHLPLLLTCIDTETSPRWPDAKRLLAFRRAQSSFEIVKAAEERAMDPEALEAQLKRKNLFIETWSAADIEADPERIGLSGSPTKVKKIQSVVLEGRDLELFTPDDSGVKKLVDKLIEERTFG